MANTSDIGSELMDRDLSVENGSSEEVDTVGECDDTSGNERVDFAPVHGLAMKIVPSEPYVGMEFESADDARKHYDEYGRRNGFTIRVNKKRRSDRDREAIGFSYVCSKEGFRRQRHLTEGRKIRLSKQPRVGCKAMLIIVYRRDMEKWAVTKFVREHNHELMILSEVPVRADKAPLNEDEKNKKIRELTAKLYSERQRFQRQCAIYEERCAAYRDQIGKILKDIEVHNDQITKKVDNVVRSMRDIEDEDSQSQSRTPTTG